MRILFFLWLVPFCLAAENWPRFRGPTGQGHSAEKNLPLSWSSTSNIIWKTALPADGWSSPVIWNDRIFLSGTTDAGAKCHVLCLDRNSGKILWNKEVLEQPLLRKEGKNSYATPTPVTNGEVVGAVFNDGSIVALDFAGNILWTFREVQHYSRHGLGASPIIYENLLVMPYDGSNRVGAAGKYPDVSDEEKLGWQKPWDRAQLVALDLKSGKRVWTGKRGMSRVAHITPLVLQVNGRDQIISCAGDAVQGFDPETGRRLWHVYSQGEGVTPSPAAGDGLLFTSSGFEKTTLRTVRLGGTDDVTATHVAWEQRKGVPTQPSLLYVAPYVYGLSDGGILTCYEGKTGEIVYQERVGGNFCASPVYADGRIYLLSEEGETTVVAPGKEFKILARNSLGEKCQASMAVSGGRLFIRTAQTLFAIGN